MWINCGVYTILNFNDPNCLYFKLHLIDYSCKKINEHFLRNIEISLGEINGQMVSVELNFGIDDIEIYKINGSNR